MERIIIYNKILSILMTKDIFLKSDTIFNDYIRLRYFDTYFCDILP